MAKKNELIKLLRNKTENVEVILAQVREIIDISNIDMATLNRTKYLR